MRVDKRLVADLKSIMTEIEDTSRKITKCEIFKLYEAGDDLDMKILDIFLTYMDKLPDEPLLGHPIKEIELIMKFLDPVLNGMLNDHSTNHSFHWTNTCGTGTEEERPDAEMSVLKQRIIEYSVGYCEVKISENSSSSVDIHNDIMRLAKFGNKLCEEENLKSSLLVLAVGFKLTFYMMIMERITFSTVFELCSIYVPNSLYALPSLFTAAEFYGYFVRDPQNMYNVTAYFI